MSRKFLILKVVRRKIVMIYFCKTPIARREHTQKTKRMMVIVSSGSKKS